MDTVFSLIIIAAAVGVFLLVLKLLTKPIRFVFKLLINAFFGFLVLLLVNFLGAAVGISLTVSFLSALLVGLLGIPGVILLILFQIF